MSEDVVKSKAIAFEALKLLYKGDDERAWNTLVSLNPDFSLPFASYTREFVADGKEETLFNEIWRSVRSAFDQERIPLSILPHGGCTLSLHSGKASSWIRKEAGGGWNSHSLLEG